MEETKRTIICNVCGRKVDQITTNGPQGWVCNYCLILPTPEITPEAC